MTDDDYYKGKLDGILEVLEKIDDDWSFESVTNFCENEVARIARARREIR